MELYELVALRNQLEPLTARTAEVYAGRELNKIAFYLDEIKNFSLNIEGLNNKLAELHQQVVNIDCDLDSVKQQLQQEITDKEKILRLDSYKNYKMSANEERVTDVETSKKLKISLEDRQIFESRIASYSQWQSAGMVIRPGTEKFIEMLVSFQPLYVLDHSNELIEIGLQKFNPMFKQRIRQYVIKDFDSMPALQKLPVEQFGLCLAYGYFDWRPIEFIADYLEQIYTKLKPGGVCVFTYNDCDWPEAVKLAMNNGATYVPGRQLKNIIASLGFDIVFSHTTQGATTWIEIKRPGKLSSIKSSPALAKILDLPATTT